MCSGSTSTHISARTAASHFDRHAAPELQHSNRADSVTATCSTSTSTHIIAQPAATTLDQQATPGISTGPQPG
jgi:hypothetical protein